MTFKFCCVPPLFHHPIPKTQTKTKETNRREEATTQKKPRKVSRTVNFRKNQKKETNTTTSKKKTEEPLVEQSTGKTQVPFLGGPSTLYNSLDAFISLTLFSFSLARKKLSFCHPRTHNHTDATFLHLKKRMED